MKNKKFSGTLFVASCDYANGAYAQIASYSGNGLNKINVVAIDCSCALLIRNRVKRLINHFLIETKFSENQDCKALYLASLLKRISKNKMFPAPENLLVLVERNFPRITREKCIYLPN